MLIDKIREDMTIAAKAKDLEKVKALRMLVAAIESEKIRRNSFSEDDEVSVLRTEAKKRQEAMDIYEKVGQDERVKAEKSELDLINSYLPQLASEEDVKKVVEEVVANLGEEVNKGQVIGMVMGKMGRDKVDGGLVAKVVNLVLA